MKSKLQICQSTSSMCSSKAQSICSAVYVFTREPLPSCLTKYNDPQHLSVSLQAPFALAAGSELKTSSMTQTDTEMYLDRGNC